MSSETPQAATCRHVRLPHVVPGWGCCRCRTYNGYQRTSCRSCGHPPCYDREGKLGAEARAFAEVGTDPDKVIRLLAERSSLPTKAHTS